MRLAQSRRAEEDDALGAVEESQLVQALDLLALDARLEGKVKLRQRLDGRQARGTHGGLQATVVAQRDLCRKRCDDRSCCATGPCGL